MATTRVQLIGPNGQDRVETVKFYVRRLTLASCTYPVSFVEGVATVSDEDLGALQAVGVVRVLA